MNKRLGPTHQGRGELMLGQPVAGRRTLQTIGRRTGRAVRAALLGALPGVAMVLVAQFVIDGEMQLTVGAPGLLLAAVGAVVGFAVGMRPIGPSSQNRTGGATMGTDEPSPE